MLKTQERVLSHGYRKLLKLKTSVIIIISKYLREKSTLAPPPVRQPRLGPGPGEESNICCPVCCDIYRDPVLLSCSHSLCKACWQRCKTVKSNPECPICRRSCSSDDPPQNLALRNVCEAFSQGSGERLSAAPSELCSLHAEKLQLFCVQDQQPVCLICQFSRWHTNHKNLKQARLAALRDEKRQKNQNLRKKREAVNREKTTITNIISSTEAEMTAADVLFLQNYPGSAARVQLPGSAGHTPELQEIYYITVSCTQSMFSFNTPQTGLSETG
uniref:RING-type domain-containing protein n=1 Tax=Kryptolebias marmoratus TaxID=37003 RepID=A0A3Q3ABN4_KRYMA